MRLVVDTNIILSALIRDGLTREILMDNTFALCMPETALEEIRRHEGIIAEKSGLGKEDLEEILKAITKSIELVGKSEYTHRIKKARDIMENIDEDDAPFIALALSLSCGIWTNDRHFMRQDAVRTWRTEDILKFIYGP